MSRESARAALLQVQIRAVDEKLSHVLEPEMRRALSAEWLLALSADEASEALERVLVARERPQATPDLLRDALFDLLSDPASAAARGLERDFLRAIFAAAHLAGHEEVKAYLLAPLAGDGEPDEAPRLPKELADLPLGQRRALAKSEDRNWLEKLARDSDPIVIAQLLQNPRLREQDVLRMAALRPVAPVALLEIGRCDRFARSPRVQAAVARNPQCPPELAVRLVARLPLAVLREMRSDANLHERTRAQVAHELARRG